MIWSFRCVIIEACQTQLTLFHRLSGETPWMMWRRDVWRSQITGKRALGSSIRRHLQGVWQEIPISPIPHRGYGDCFGLNNIIVVIGRRETYWSQCRTIFEGIWWRKRKFNGSAWERSNREWLWMIADHFTWNVCLVLAVYFSFSLVWSFSIFKLQIDFRFLICRGVEVIVLRWGWLAVLVISVNKKRHDLIVGPTRVVLCKDRVDLFEECPLEESRCYSLVWE